MIILFNKIKARYLWIMALVLFLIGVGLIFLIPVLNIQNTTPIVIVLVIIFIVTTFLVQSATYKSFSKKMKRKYVKKVYVGTEDIKELMLNKGFKNKEEVFGESFYYKDKIKAYKVSVITKSDLFFLPEENKKETEKPVVDFSKCKKLAGIDIFLDINDNVLDKAPDFTINTKTFSYIALTYENDKFILNNYEEIEDLEIKEMMQFLFDTLGLKEVNN